jgi:hypothetical protein
MDAGFQLFESWAFGFELPYMRRHPGNSDQFIEDFHDTINFYQYLRHIYPDNRTRLRVAVDGVETLSDDHPADGLSSVKLKLKKRLLQTGGTGCPCGVAVSVQANLPVNGDQRGLSSGTETYSILGHAGLPLGAESAIYLTTGFSVLGQNRFFIEWPMNRITAMGDISFDLGIGGGIGFLMSFSGYSPWMHSRFDFVSTTSDPDYTKHERISSAYNSLFRWRGYQNYGFRYRWGLSGSQISLFIFEDFGFGDYDARSELTYNNNSPDVLIGSQLSLRF